MEAQSQKSETAGSRKTIRMITKNDQEIQITLDQCMITAHDDGKTYIRGKCCESVSRDFQVSR